MSTINVSAARQTLPAQLDRVAAGEEVAITRHGRVVAVLVSPETLRRLPGHEAQQNADLIRELLNRVRVRPFQPAPIPAERVDELVDTVRADRADRSAR